MFIKNLIFALVAMMSYQNVSAQAQACNGQDKVYFICTMTEFDGYDFQNRDSLRKISICQNKYRSDAYYLVLANAHQEHLPYVHNFDANLQMTSEKGGTRYTFRYYYNGVGRVTVENSANTGATATYSCQSK